MAQQYQVDIVTKVVGASSVEKLEKALEKVQASSKAVDNTAEGVATSLRKLRNAAKESATGVAKAQLALEKLRLANLQSNKSVDQAAVALQKLKVATAQAAVAAAQSAKDINGAGSASRNAGGFFSRFGDTVKDLKGRFQNLLTVGNAVKAFFAIEIVKGIVAMIGSFIQANMAVETTKKQLEALVGSAGQAKQIFDELVRIDYGSPFQLKEITDAALKLKAFGVETRNLVDTTERLAKMAALTGQAIDGIALAYGQVIAKGRLQGEELLQFQERGINLASELTKMLGLSTREFLTMVQKGQVSSKLVTVAIQNMTNEGGKFADGFSATADTVETKLANLHNAVNSLKVAIGELTKDSTKDFLKLGEMIASSFTSIIYRSMRLMKDPLGEFRRDQQALNQALEETKKKYGEAFNLNDQEQAVFFARARVAAQKELNKEANAKLGINEDETQDQQDIRELLQEHQRSQKEKLKLQNMLSSAVQKELQLQQEVVQARMQEMQTQGDQSNKSVEERRDIMMEIIGLAQRESEIVKEMANNAYAKAVNEAQSQLDLQQKSLSALRRSADAQGEITEEMQGAITAQESQVQLASDTLKLAEREAKAQRKITLERQKTQELLKTTQAIAQQMNMLQQDNQKSLDAELRGITLLQNVKQAQLNAERQINDAKLMQANADLNAAQTAGERESAAQRIKDLTIQNAKLEYDATMASAKAELQKVAAAERHALQLLKQVETEVALQRSKRIYNVEQDKALNSAREGVAVATQNLNAQEKIYESTRKGAIAMRDAKTEAAGVAFEANRIFENTNAAVGSANALADAYGRAASAASAAAGAASGAGGGVDFGLGTAGSTTSKTYRVYDEYKLDENGNIVETTAEERNRQINQQQVQYMNYQMKNIQVHNQGTKGTMVGPPGSLGFSNEMTSPNPKVMSARQAQTYTDQLDATMSNWISSMVGTQRPFAKGGYVDKPTNALIGEGGEGEYVIPESKLSATMQNYRAGKRGSDMIPDSANVNVEYKGSTVQMGGTTYINKDDVSGIVSQAVNATLTTLKKSPKARLEAGMR